MLWTFLRQADRSRIRTLVVFFQEGPFRAAISALRIPAVLLPAGRLRHVRTAATVVRSLADLLRRERPDLVLNWTAEAQVYGATAAILARMADRVVWWQHGIADGHWLDRLATLLPARAVACSSGHSADAQRDQWPRRRTIIVYPGIDVPARPTRASSRGHPCRSRGQDFRAPPRDRRGRVAPHRGGARAPRTTAPSGSPLSLPLPGYAGRPGSQRPRSRRAPYCR